MNNEIVREKIKYIRNLKGYTQLDVSKGTKIPKANVTYLETGKRTITFKSLEKLADFYNIDVTYFIDDKIAKENFKYKTKDSNIVHVIGRNGDKQDIDLSEDKNQDETKLTEEEIKILKKLADLFKNKL